MATYADVADKKNQLIRRAKNGSVFIAPIATALPTSLTSGAGAPLTALPSAWVDLGWTTTEGVAFERETEQVEIQSFGSPEATRSDVTRDEVSMTMTAQETKLETIALSTGASIASLIAAATTGELQVAKPTTPVLPFYRVLALFLDHNDAGQEIYFGRLMPRAQINDFGSQTYNEDETGIAYPMTWRGYEDSSAGFSHKWFWAGPGWLALLSDMDIPQAS